MSLVPISSPSITGPRKLCLRFQNRRHVSAALRHRYRSRFLKEVSRVRRVTADDNTIPLMPTLASISTVSLPSPLPSRFTLAASTFIANGFDGYSPSNPGTQVEVGALVDVEPPPPIARDFLLLSAIEYHVFQHWVADTWIHLSVSIFIPMPKNTRKWLHPSRNWLIPLRRSFRRKRRYPPPPSSKPSTTPSPIPEPRPVSAAIEVDFAQPEGSPLIIDFDLDLLPSSTSPLPSKFTLAMSTPSSHTVSTNTHALALQILMRILMRK
ncbi:hypothetical protein BDP27DRAFT_1413790 [Rhodocollybia butyracea]|uniref:Uncharacterized protein n=1 Tax=Rhodocollybia butyracea TaxID=206335 RepID=A0A9P5Q3D6_9AGAR|nr:hypothetical protein BDP27DRAFT_1413790 [Rhodocollybia butyracea]